MFRNNQIVSADEIFNARWQIDSHSELTHSTSYVSPDGAQVATIYEGHEQEVKIENL